MPIQSDTDSARDRVIEGLIHLTVAMNAAKIENPDGIVGLAVISKIWMAQGG